MSNCQFHHTSKSIMNKLSGEIQRILSGSLLLQCITKVIECHQVQTHGKATRYKRLCFYQTERSKQIYAALGSSIVVLVIKFIATCMLLIQFATFCIQ